MMHVSLPRIVQIAHAQGYCAHSPMSLNDSFPSGNGKLEDIVGMATVTLRGKVVGWIYRTASGRFYAQANQKMPAADQRAAGTLVKPPRSAPATRRFLSAIVEIQRDPWTDLSVTDCKGSDFSKKI